LDLRSSGNNQNRDSNSDVLIHENHLPPRPRWTRDVGGLWGVSLAVHAAIKEKLNDPDCYKFIEVYEPKVSDWEKKPCWIEVVKFRAKNGFGGYMIRKAVIALTV
jgi:hypothetical protein